MQEITFDVNRCHAAIKLQQARNYLHDLKEFYAGDDGRFNRMVVEGGKNLATAHPQGWAQHIVAVLGFEYVAVYFAEEAAGIMTVLRGMGLVGEKEGERYGK